MDYRVQEIDGLAKVIAGITVLVHILYFALFYLVDMKFMLWFLVFEICIFALSFVLILINTTFIKLFIYVVHIETAISNVLSSATLGLGYGFDIINIFLISISYVLNFKNYKIPIYLGAFEFISVIVAHIISYNTPNYANEYMHIVFLFNLIIISTITVAYHSFIAKVNSKAFLTLEKRASELRKKVSKDYLTKTFNRHAMKEILALHKVRFKNREIKKFAVAICDIDNFKSLNDTFGHSLGDEVLAKIGGLLGSHYCNGIGNMDVARWGGEEFLIVFANCELEYILQRLEDTKNKIEQLTINNNNLNIVKCTMSFGLAITYDEFEIDTMLKNADLMLYKSKLNGKNQINYVVVTNDKRY